MKGAGVYFNQINRFKFPFSLMLKNISEEIMGSYVQLDCLDCNNSLSFGKPIGQDTKLNLRMFSDKAGEWREGVECWHAVQMFLFQHMGHSLVFRTDDSFEAQSIENASSFDEMISE